MDSLHFAGSYLHWASDKHRLDSRAAFAGEELGSSDQYQEYSVVQKHESKQENKDKTQITKITNETISVSKKKNRKRKRE